MRLNKSTSHAIRILIDCARAEGGVTKVADLSTRLGLTQQNVFKIVNILARGKLIIATRGRHGGVRLARPAQTIRVGDIVRTMETTELELELDGHAGETPGRSVDEVNRLLDGALEAFIEVLDNHSLADLAGGTTRRAAGKPRTRRAPPLREKALRVASSTLAPRTRAQRTPR